MKIFVTMVVLVVKPVFAMSQDVPTISINLHQLVQGDKC